MAQFYDKIVPTAWIVAYRRKFSDIPFSNEIFNHLNSLREERFGNITDEVLNPKLSPQYEARQKIIDKYILLSNTNQVLELASGFTSRGLYMSANSKVVYVEFDLPKVMEDKIIIANSIIESEGLKCSNLYFESGNALNYNDLIKSLKHFKQEPITIINEGLLRYLNFEEKTTVAKNIHKILTNYGGQWITSDITLKKLLEVENDVSRQNEQTSYKTGIDIDKNRFEDESHAKSFFQDLGFSIERHSFAEVKQNLVSHRILDLSDEEVNNLIDFAVIYVMRPK